MAFNTGVHVACGYVMERQGAALLSIITDSATSAAASGITDFAAPSALHPPGWAGGASAPRFELSATVDTFVSVGPNPNAATGPRVLVRAGTDRPFFCNAGDRLAWVAA